MAPMNPSQLGDPGSLPRIDDDPDRPVPTTPPGRMARVTKVLTRADAMAAGQEIFPRLGRRGQGELLRKVKGWLVRPEVYLVLPTEWKDLVGGYCEICWPEFLDSINKELAERDMETCEYTEVIQEPVVCHSGPEGFDIPPINILSSSGTVEDPRLQHLRRLVTRQLEAEYAAAKNRYNRSVSMLRDAHEELRHSVRILGSVADPLEMAIVAVEWQIPILAGLLGGISKVLARPEEALEREHGAIEGNLITQDANELAD